MLNELQAIVDTGEFEDNGWINLLAAEWHESDLSLTLIVNPGNDSLQRWRLRCGDVLEYQIAAAGDCGFNHWSSDHPALDQYTEPHDQLYFSGAVPNPREGVGALWLAHRSHADDWYPLERYVNTEVPLDALLAGGHGLLASGPRTLLEIYAEALRSLKCSPNVVASVAGPRHDHAELVHFGEAFVIFKSLDVERLGDRSAVGPVAN